MRVRADARIAQLGAMRSAEMHHVRHASLGEALLKLEAALAHHASLERMLKQAVSFAHRAKVARLLQRVA